MKNKVLDALDFMFDISEQYLNKSYVMLSNNLVRNDEIRDLFYKNDLTCLDDFLVIINIHAEGYLGTYLVHTDIYNTLFKHRDDYSILFSIKDYNLQKKSRILTQKYDILSEVENFKDDIYFKSSYMWYKDEKNIKYLKLRTKWNAITLNNKVIALISEKDSATILKQIDNCSMFRVKSLKEGIEYFKM